MSEPIDRTTKITAKVIDKIIEDAGDKQNDPYLEAADDYYEPAMCDMIKIYAEDVMFPEQWAELLGIPEKEMYGFVRKYPEFARAFAMAMTILRSRFTAKMWEAARGRVPDAMAPLFTMFAKTRFPDLYGDKSAGGPPAQGQPQQPQHSQDMKDVTPDDQPVGQLVDGTVLTEQDIDAELKQLRERHGVQR